MNTKRTQHEVYDLWFPLELVTKDGNCYIIKSAHEAEKLADRIRKETNWEEVDRIVFYGDGKKFMQVSEYCNSNFFVDRLR